MADRGGRWHGHHRGMGGRGRGGGGERGGAGRGRGRGRGGHPPGLSGKDIGLWYARQGGKKKKEREIQGRERVNMNEDQEKRVRRMLEQVKSLRQSHPAPAQPKPRDRNRDAACQSFYDYVLKDNPEMNAELKAELKSKQSNHKYQAMRAFREKLPSFKMKDELVSLIQSNQVVVISGETGCGKTTQVPQFILDDYIAGGQGSTCRIVCTQPRRISAISVAERVAAERAEDCGHDMSVGYQIRLENAFPRRQACILYCTTGILLKWLESDKLLKSVSHVVLDEVHERDIHSDFILVILKELLHHRPDLKLILMSATLKAELFSEFFGDAPMTNIPGFTFPVTEYYVEDILQRIDYKPPSEGSSRRKEPTWVKYKRGKRFREEEREREEKKQHQLEEYISAMQGTYSESVIESLKSMDHEALDLDLTAALIKHICLHKPEGAILVFLPGWDQISKLHDQLTSQRFFASQHFLIIPLHSMMPTINQRQVFDHPPPGVRKIIIATNIAETSITIDDVVYVLDAGKVKETNFDVENNVSTLKAEWISKASARQRRGRAGRVKEGECYHVYSQLKASCMAEYQLPEIQRTPLEELCLNIKTLKLGHIIPFLSKSLQPPDTRAIALAIKNLTQMNALDANENLTPLGFHLSRLPVSPCVGKMILFGAMFCCLDPVLTIAASLGWKDPFYIPLGKEKLADERRRDLANNSRSDHLMLCNAMSGWEEARETREDGAYCWRNFLSGSNLKMLSKMKEQFSEVLHDLRFTSHSSSKHPAANRNSGNGDLVKAMLCAGLYPKVAHIDKVPFNRRTGQSRPPKLSTPGDGRVVIHPKSVNANETNFTSKWLLYHLKLKSTSVFLHDTTMIEPYPLLFCGGTISWEDDDGHETVFIDDHIKFHCSQDIATLVMKLRAELDWVLEQKILAPGPTDWSPDTHEGKVMRAIVDVITMETDHTQNDDDFNQGFVHQPQVYDNDENFEEDDSGYTNQRYESETQQGRGRGWNEGNRGQGRWEEQGQGAQHWRPSHSGGGRRGGGWRRHRDFEQDNGEPKSNHWRPDSQRRRYRDNEHEGYWNKR